MLFILTINGMLLSVKACVLFFPPMFIFHCLKPFPSLPDIFSCNKCSGTLSLGRNSAVFGEQRRQ